MDDAQKALETVLEREDRPVATAVEVGDVMGVSRPTATARLWEQVGAGEVATDRVGQTRIWWLTPAFTPAKTPANTPAKNTPEPPDEEVTPAKTTANTPAKTDIESWARAWIDDELGWSGEKLDQTADALAASYDYLRENSPAYRREIIADVMPNHDGGYDHPDFDEIRNGDKRFKGSWWVKVVSPGLDSRDDIEKPQGGGRWRYVR